MRPALARALSKARALCLARALSMARALSKARALSVARGRLVARGLCLARSAGLGQLSGPIVGPGTIWRSCRGCRAGRRAVTRTRHDGQPVHCHPAGPGSHPRTSRTPPGGPGRWPAAIHWKSPPSW